MCMLVAEEGSRWSTLGPLAFLYKETVTLQLPSILFPPHNPTNYMYLDSNQAQIKTKRKDVRAFNRKNWKCRVGNTHFLTC